MSTNARENVRKMASMASASAEVGPVMARVSSYIAAAARTDLPEEVVERAKLHLLDTVAAIISGTRLLPGIRAVNYARAQGGKAEAVVIGSDFSTNAMFAALANGMSAHADETDDSHRVSRSHLGCAVVPAALAMAERNGASGAELIRAIVLGYDIGSRSTMALSVEAFYNGGHSTHSFAAAFGAAAAAGALARLDADQVRWLLSYASQQASGVNCWRRDREHIEKAFDFGGMAARNGVASATMVEAGFTGVDDVFSGPRNFFFAFGKEPDPSLLCADLGHRFELVNTNIKKWSVGSPIQAVLDSLEALYLHEGLRPPDIEAIHVRMSDKEADTVNDRDMPDICLQHLSALLLVDGALTFETSHDAIRMSDPAVRELRSRITLTADPELPRRKPVVCVRLADGRHLKHATEAVRGSAENPMSRAEVEAKALGLIEPTLGGPSAQALIDEIGRIDRSPSLDRFTRLVRVEEPDRR